MYESLRETLELGVDSDMADAFGSMGRLWPNDKAIRLIGHSAVSDALRNATD